jgi:hypothetical protein
MSTSEFLRARIQAHADNNIATLIFVGGAAVTGYLIRHYALVLGLDSRLAWALAWAAAMLVFVALSLLLKPKSIPIDAPPSSPPQTQTQTQTVHVNVNTGERAAEPSAEPEPTPRPCFNVTVPVTSKPRLVRMDVNLLRTAMPDEAGVLYPILVEFENLPSGQGKSAEVNDVWAHITYRDFDFMNAELARVGSGCWIDQPVSDVSFPIRTPRYLMLGGWHVDKAEPMVNEFRIFEYSRDLHRAVEKEVKICGPKEPFVMVNRQLVGIAQRRLVIDVVLTSNGHHDDGCEYQFQVAIFGGDGTGHSITCAKKP